LPPGPTPPLWPLWVAISLSVLASLLDILVRKHPSVRWLSYADWTFSIAGGLYYFMIVYRLTKVMESQPQWWGSYSPIGVVLRLFVPLYNLWVLYYWTKEIGRYLDWRLNRSSDPGLKTFLGLVLMGIVSAFGDAGSIIGGIGMSAAFYFLYIPLRSMLNRNPPIQSTFGRGDMALGLN
jgi:hypothetical protein